MGGQEVDYLHASWPGTPFLCSFSVAQTRQALRAALLPKALVSD